MASALEDETKDVATRDRTSQSTPDVVDDIASALTSSVQEDVHERTQSVVARVSNNVNISRHVDNHGVDSRGIVAVAAIISLVELLDDIVERLSDAVTVAESVLGLDAHVIGLVRAQGLGRAPTAGEHDGEGTLAGDVLAELIEGLVELIEEELAGVFLGAVALLVVAFTAFAGLVVEGATPLLSAVAPGRCQWVSQMDCDIVHTYRSGSHRERRQTGWQ